MSFQSPIFTAAGCADAQVPHAAATRSQVAHGRKQAERDSAQVTLARWGERIEILLKLTRNALLRSLGNAQLGDSDSQREQIDAALAECDAIEVSTAALIIPCRTKHTSFLGHLVAELEAAVAHAEHEAKIAALQAHKARLDALLINFNER